MEQFYQLLRAYNIDLSSRMTLPEWTSIYRGCDPPVYWRVLGRILENLPKDYSVLDIGSGLGDVVSLLRYLGFHEVLGVERDNVLAEQANRKVEILHGVRDSVLCDSYPISLEKCPDIIIQVNCVYHDQLTSRSQYLKILREWMFYNGAPRLYILEVLDQIHISSRYPEFVHLSGTDIQSTFADCRISSLPTYRFPDNTSSKRIYILEPETAVG